MRLAGADGLTPSETEGVVTLLRELVAGGAAIGWVDPPAPARVRRLLDEVVGGIAGGNAALALAVVDERVAGVGYWVRYARETHRPHADLEKLGVDPAVRGRGLGRELLGALIGAARQHGVEVLTLDVRGDNVRAAALYVDMGFEQYGRLSRFVAVGDARYDKLFYALDLRGGPRAGPAREGVRPHEPW